MDRVIDVLAQMTVKSYRCLDIFGLSMSWHLSAKSYKFQVSMSRKGNPYDNAFAESFMKTLKSEEVHLWEYHTIEDAQRRIPYFCFFDIFTFALGID